MLQYGNTNTNRTPKKQRKKVALTLSLFLKQVTEVIINFLFFFGLLWLQIEIDYAVLLVFYFLVIFKRRHTYVKGGVNLNSNHDV